MSEPGCRFGMLHSFLPFVLGCNQLINLNCWNLRIYFCFLICTLPDLRAVVMTCRSPRSMARASMLFSDELSIQRSTAFLVVSHFLPTFLPGSSHPWRSPR